jgi:hypothetical protein
LYSRLRCKAGGDSCPRSTLPSSTSSRLKPTAPAVYWRQRSTRAVVRRAVCATWSCARETETEREPRQGWCAGAGRAPPLGPGRGAHLFSLYSLAASELAGELGLGSQSSDCGSSRRPRHGLAVGGTAARPWLAAALGAAAWASSSSWSPGWR